MRLCAYFFSRDIDINCPRWLLLHAAQALASRRRVKLIAPACHERMPGKSM
jgi:hypothetical protein